MEITVKNRGRDWVVEFNHGCQYFTLDYFVETKEEADFMKNMLSKCFARAFGDKWHENSNCDLDIVSKNEARVVVCECDGCDLPAYGDLNICKDHFVSGTKEQTDC